MIFGIFKQPLKQLNRLGIERKKLKWTIISGVSTAVMAIAAVATVILSIAAYNDKQFPAQKTAIPPVKERDIGKRQNNGKKEDSVEERPKDKAHSISPLAISEKPIVRGPPLPPSKIHSEGTKNSVSTSQEPENPIVRAPPLPPTRM